MRFAYCRVVVAAIVMAALYPTSMASAEPKGSEPSADRVERAIEFRTTFGLRADQDHVRAVERRGGAPGSSNWGVALTRDELANLENRLLVRSATGPVDDYVRAHDDLSGGWWIDQRRGGRIVVQFTDDPNHHEANLREAFAYPEQLDVVRVQHALVDLTSTHRRIADDRAELESAGIIVHSIKTDIAGNRVEVAVDHSSEGARSELMRRYGSASAWSRAKPPSRQTGRTTIHP